MKTTAGKPLKWLYCLTLIASFPSGLFGATGWTALATGGGWMRAGLIILLPVLCMIIYRIVLVARYHSTLDAYVTGKLVKTLRVLGIILMITGLLGTVLIIFLQPIALGIFGKPGDNGIAYFVVGVYLYFISSAGLPGVLLFEASRLLGFEQDMRETEAY